MLIRDGGEIAADRPMPIRAFCEGNASVHLDAHSEQLRALQVPTAEDAPGSPGPMSAGVLEQPIAAAAVSR